MRKIQGASILAIVGMILSFLSMSYTYHWGTGFAMKLPPIPFFIMAIAGSLLIGCFFLTYWRNLKGFPLFRGFALVASVVSLLNTLLFILFEVNRNSYSSIIELVYVLAWCGMPCIWLAWASFSAGMYFSKSRSKAVRVSSALNAIVSCSIALTFLLNRYFRYGLMLWVIGIVMTIILLTAIYQTQNNNLKRKGEQG